MPLNIYYAWSERLEDDQFISAIKASAATIAAAADAEGQAIGDAFLYGNYAVGDTPLTKIYGNNLSRLEGIKAKYDPNNVMGLAGGWKLQPGGSEMSLSGSILQRVLKFSSG